MIGYCKWVQTNKHGTLTKVKALEVLITCEDEATLGQVVHHLKRDLPVCYAFFRWRCRSEESDIVVTKAGRDFVFEAAPHGTCGVANDRSLFMRQWFEAIERVTVDSVLTEEVQLAEAATVATAIAVAVAAAVSHCKGQ